MRVARLRGALRPGVSWLYSYSERMVRRELLRLRMRCHVCMPVCVSLFVCGIMPVLLG